jgi:hypothetical protein
MPQPTLILPRSGSPRLVSPALFPPGTQNDYIHRVLHTRPGNLIAYWPLDENTNTRAHDLSGNGLHVAATGVDWSQPGIGDGRTAPYFDGVNDYINIYPVLTTTFNGQEGTLLGWGKAPNSTVWGDGTNHQIARILVDGSNYVWLRTSTTPNKFDFAYRAGGVTLTQTLAIVPAICWYAFGITWSKSSSMVRAYLSGQAVGIPRTGVGTWAGALDSGSCAIGSRGAPTAEGWNGNIAHCALWNCALTPQEMGILGRQP